MSTSIILLDQNFSANDVDIMVFEPSVLLPPPQFGGGGGVDDMVLSPCIRVKSNITFCIDWIRVLTVSELGDRALIDVYKAQHG